MEKKEEQLKLNLLKNREKVELGLVTHCLKNERKWLFGALAGLIFTAGLPFYSGIINSISESIKRDNSQKYNNNRDYSTSNININRVDIAHSPIQD